MQIFLALGAVLFAASVSLGASEGDPLPSFELTDAGSARQVSPKALLAGASGALVYMQTACAACRKELVAVKEIKKKYPELKVVVVSVDAGSPEKIAHYKEQYQLDFPFVLDPDFKTPGLFGFSFTPGLVLVDKQGKIVHVKGGYRPGDEVDLEQRVRGLSK